MGLGSQVKDAGTRCVEQLEVGLVGRAVVRILRDFRNRFVVRMSALFDGNRITLRGRVGKIHGEDYGCRAGCVGSAGWKAERIGEKQDWQNARKKTNAGGAKKCGLAAGTDRARIHWCKLSPASNRNYAKN